MVVMNRGIPVGKGDRRIHRLKRCLEDISELDVLDEESFRINNNNILAENVVETTDSIVNMVGV